MVEKKQPSSKKIMYKTNVHPNIFKRYIEISHVLKVTKSMVISNCIILSYTDYILYTAVKHSL